MLRHAVLRLDMLPTCVLRSGMRVRQGMKWQR